MLDQPFIHSLGTMITTWGPTFVLTVAWIAWWLWAVNWKSVWPALAHGGWAPLVLVVMVSALVWSQITPADCGCLGFVTIPNFWWQLGEVSMLAALALLCGWLQGYFHWTPGFVEFEPSSAGHGHHGHHDHGDHGHGHEHGHGGHEHGHGGQEPHSHGGHGHGDHHERGHQH